jgi:hypothetical protein
LPPISYLPTSGGQLRDQTVHFFERIEQSYYRPPPGGCRRLRRREQKSSWVCQSPGFDRIQFQTPDIPCQFGLSVPAVQKRLRLPAYGLNIHFAVTEFTFADDRATKLILGGPSRNQRFVRLTIASVLGHCSAPQVKDLLPYRFIGSR